MVLFRSHQYRCTYGIVVRVLGIGPVFWEDLEGKTPVYVGAQ